MQMPKLIASLALIAFCLLAPAPSTAAEADAKILAPEGKLRVGLYPGTPTSILPNPSGEPRGVGYELGRELAKRLGVPYEPVVFPRNAEVQAALKGGHVDAIFTNASASRAQEMDFAQPYLEIELGYLVAKDSPVKAISDIDQTGRRIGVTKGSTSDSTLSRDLKNVEIVRADTNGAGAEMLAAGKIDAFATNKATLFELAEKVPGSKVLEGNWGLERHAIAIPKGRDQGMGFLKKFTDEVKANGTVQSAIERSGLRGARIAR